MSAEAQARLEDKLYWMLDRPFFIDSPQLAAFYDAVVQPKVKADQEFELVLTDETAKGLEKTLGGELDIGAIAGGLGKVLTPLSIKAGGERTWVRNSGESSTQTMTFRPIETPQRQLIQLTSQYLVNFPDRIFFVDDVRVDVDWTKPGVISTLPRGLVFLDLPGVRDARENHLPETELIPMALEFDDGRIETLYDKFKAERRGESWEEYIERFDPHEAIRVIESATGGKGNIAWINYRIPLDEERTFRVHFDANGEYNNGTFAYNLVQMGYEHGVRLIGTVNQGPDVRVLAGYLK